MSLRPRFSASVGGWLALGAAVALPGAALAQTDYSRGKSPPQLFASDCSACHRSPQGLAAGRDARSLTAFLHDHYTTKIEWAGLLANYLVGVGGTKSQRAPVTSPTAAPAPAAAAPGTPAPATAATGTPAPAATGPAAAEPAAPVPPAPVPSAAAPSAPVAAAPAAAAPATGARDRGKPADPRSAKGKTTEGEGDAGAKAGGETLQAKLRGYATAGEEAKPAAPAAGTPTPGLRPSADAVPAPQPGGQPPRPDGGAVRSPDAPAGR